MNRLILIGNGFDLAHGLETSYLNFIVYLMKQGLNLKMSEGREHKLFEIDIDKTFEIGNRYFISVRDSDLNRLIETLISKNEIKYIIRNASPFFLDVLDSLSNNRWVDLEYTYFRYIDILSQSSQLYTTSGNIFTIKELNEEWEMLRDQLKEYLSPIQKTDYKDLDFKKYFYEKHRNLVNMNADQAGITNEVEISNHYFINFNYTITYRRYINSDDLDRCIDIHGLLLKDTNRLIFGWGDDSHTSYRKIEELNDNRYLKHTKSFGYLQNRKYKTLSSILSSSPFEVYIFGHSCGLSDRTMLESIFNSPECVQIKIFYHETKDGNDYNDKAIEISRHCPNKVGLRNKIISLEDSVSMPNIMG